MFHYLFTNDLRISNLESFLTEAGRCFVNDSVPSAAEDKNANNNMNTLGFYFNLTKESNCSLSCMNGNIRKVVLNFIKKFQFPNPRTTESLNFAISDGITLAPMRVILQTLYILGMTDEKNAFLTKAEIAKYIFFNEEIAKRTQPNIMGLVDKILDNRREGFDCEFPSESELEAEECYWKQCKRQVREMVKVLCWSGCVKESDKGDISICHDELTRENEADLFEILTYKGRWIPDSDKNASENKQSYQAYMDIEEIVNSAEIQNDLEYDDVLNHSLFGMHIKQENDALSEENPHICIGWSVLGDLSDIESREQLSDVYGEKIEKNSRGKGQDVGQVWRFLHDMSIGDYVIFAENSVFHIGRIESDYYYDDSENPNQSADYTNNRKVKWLKKNISRSELSDSMHNSLKTAMSVWTLNDYKSAVVDLLRGTYVKDGAVDMEDEYKELVFNTKIQVDAERNRIIFGAPGTGKSYGLKKDCKNLMKDRNGMYERVTFHPDYSYSQFVGTYKPVMDTDGKSIKYDFVPGPFMRVYVEALRSGRTDNPQPYLLLIEEINRAKVAAVFGDVFQLLDRDEDGVSEYEIQASEDIRRYLAKELGGNPANYQRIKIPNNMFIWSTMNSADQGVFPMDTAFKRRWNFEYLGINENEEEIAGKGKIMLAGCDEPVEWNILRRAINDKMSTDQFKINEDKLMGPFFLSKKILASDDEGMIVDPETFIKSFKSKVIMYLYEDAVKQGKHRFFDGCDNSKYSSVCDAFDEIGMGIFGQNFKENFYDKQKDEV